MLTYKVSVSSVSFDGNSDSMSEQQVELLGGQRVILGEQTHQLPDVCPHAGRSSPQVVLEELADEALVTEEAAQAGVGGQGAQQGDAVFHRGARTAITVRQSGIVEREVLGLHGHAFQGTSRVYYLRLTIQDTNLVLHAQHMVVVIYVN